LHVRLSQGGEGEDRKALRRVLLPSQLSAPEEPELILADGNNLLVTAFGRRQCDIRHDGSPCFRC
jgi:hypothetical protein